LTVTVKLADPGRRGRGGVPWMRSSARAAGPARGLRSPDRVVGGDVSLWSHGAGTRKHLHIAVQPVTAAVVTRYGGLRSEQLQARMLASGDEPDLADVERFCRQTRALFQRITSTRNPG